MLRQIIHIDEEKCNGCGACADACHEGAIGMKNGKAVLLQDDYCDGLGNCLPVCPTGAITFVQREAAAYDEEAVRAKMAEKAALAAEEKARPVTPSRGCPGSAMRDMAQRRTAAPAGTGQGCENCLSQWPIQIKLAPVNAPWLQDSHLLLAADCSAFARGDFHERFIRGHVTLIGCPKLDMVDYSEKLTQILRRNSVRDITLVRMEVPCCGGLEVAVRRALEAADKPDLPVRTVILGIDGSIIQE